MPWTVVKRILEIVNAYFAGAFRVVQGGGGYNIMNNIIIVLSKAHKEFFVLEQQSDPIQESEKFNWEKRYTQAATGGHGSCAPGLGFGAPVGFPNVNALCKIRMALPFHR